MKKIPNYTEKQLQEIFEWALENHEDPLAILYLDACELVGKTNCPQLKALIQMRWPKSKSKNMPWLAHGVNIYKTKIEYRNRLAHVLWTVIKEEKKDGGS